MAKNYTFNEVVKIIAKGTDFEALTDIGRRYPVLAHKIAVVAAKAGEDFVDLMGYMPDYLTANKVNTIIKDGISKSGSEEDTEAAEAEAEDEAPVKVKDSGEDAAETTVQWDESMSAKQLWEILGKAGKRKLAKSTKKADLIEACKQAFGATAEAEDVEDTEEEADAAETNPYEGKSAMELYKECKARKIKAAPKKPAKFYADLLIKDDAAKAKAAEAEAEDDDWGEDEAEVDKKEDKKASKAAAKGGKDKATKAEAKSEEEEEDWDI